jgi:hypothetical protein
MILSMPFTPLLDFPFFLRKITSFEGHTSASRTVILLAGRSVRIVCFSSVKRLSQLPYLDPESPKGVEVLISQAFTPLLKRKMSTSAN